MSDNRKAWTSEVNFIIILRKIMLLILLLRNMALIDGVRLVKGC